MSVQFSFGQEQFGSTQSNYSPATTVYHNPSSIVDSEVMIDLHVFGIGGFLHSNYAYLPASEFSYFGDVVLKGEIPDAQFNKSRESYSLYSAVDFQYLSGTYQYKEHGFALTSRLRAFGDVRNVPEIFANSIQIPQITGESDLSTNVINRDLSMQNVNISVLSYAEVGVSYANAIKHFDRHLVIVGGTVKKLWGVTGGGIQINNLDYRIDTAGTFTYNNLNATSATADGLLGGGGWAFDFGITYKRMLDNVTSYNPFRKEAGCRIYDYKWKVAASIIDVGYVKFSKDASKNTISNVSGSIEDFSSFSISGDPSCFFTSAFGVDENNIENDTSFLSILPAAFVFQYDHNFEKNNLYFSVQFMNGLTPKGAFGIKRPQVLIFTPRYENRFLEVAFPLGLYNLQEIRTGLMVRVGPVTVGTDKLGTFLSVTDVTGFDFYAHIAFKILQQKKCGKKRVW